MIKPIRVLCVFSTLDRGGAETMCMNLYRKIDRSKVQFDFVKHTDAIGAYEDEITKMGGKVFNAPKLQLSQYVKYVQWWKKHFIGHPEHIIVHIHFFTITGAIVPIAHKMHRTVIGHSHGNTNIAGIKQAVRMLFLRMGSAQVDYAFACSNAAGHYMYGNGEFIVLNNAIDTREYEYDVRVRETIRKKFGINNEILIGHVGNFSYVKNHRFLFDIFSVIKERKTNVKLMLVGDGSLHDELEKQAKKQGIFDDIIFTGARSDVNELVQAMDFFVFPSLYEGLGIVLIEAQASGLSCVMSDKVPNEAIVTDDLVTVMSLEQSAEEWADHILSRLGEERCGRADEVKKHGYDIVDIANWLEEFYLSIDKDKNKFE